MTDYKSRVCHSIRCNCSLSCCNLRYHHKNNITFFTTHPFSSILVVVIFFYIWIQKTNGQDLTNKRATWNANHYIISSIKTASNFPSLFPFPAHSSSFPSSPGRSLLPQAPLYQFPVCVRSANFHLFSSSFSRCLLFSVPQATFRRRLCLSLPVHSLVSSYHS